MTDQQSTPTPAEAEFWADTLRSNGYCVIPDALPPSQIAALDRSLDANFSATPWCRGDFYGMRTKRFGRLLTRAPGSAALAQHPLVLSVVRHLLEPWCDTIQLNLMQAIEIHPGELAQVPHRDHDMWYGDKGRIEYLVNVMWPLSPFRPENGATVVWPGSHGIKALGAPPQEAGTAITCDPGSAILFLGSTLHHAGANRTTQPRRGIVAGYSLGWLKPYENPWLAYPPEVARSLPASLAALIGYRQHRPNLGNFEGQCPSILLRDIVADHLAATDALTSEQAAMVSAHAAQQRERGHPPPTSS